MESFDRFQLAGLALICLKNETKADAERDLRDLISAAGADVTEKARRERLLRHLESADKAHPLELAKYSLERAGASSSEMDIKHHYCRFKSCRTGSRLDVTLVDCIFRGVRCSEVVNASDSFRIETGRPSLEFEVAPAVTVRAEELSRLAYNFPNSAPC